MYYCAKSGNDTKIREYLTRDLELIQDIFECVTQYKRNDIFDPYMYSYGYKALEIFYREYKEYSYHVGVQKAIPTLHNFIGYSWSHKDGLDHQSETVLIYFEYLEKKKPLIRQALNQTSLYIKVLVDIVCEYMPQTPKKVNRIIV